jgi:hypothetical protein
VKICRLVTLAFLLLVQTAAAATLQPIDLTVEGGQESWHYERVFSLHWTNPPGVASVHYRLLDPDGDVAQAETTIDAPETRIRSIEVRGDPGIYTAELWLEGAGGAMGEPVGARLRFDDGLPGAVAPAPIPGWIGRTAFPYAVRLGRPAGTAPLSGIRGYAVSVDREASGRPCAGEICDDSEVDLRGGADDNRIAFGELPEGTWYVHAVAVSGSGVPSASAGTTALRVDTTDPATRLDGIPEGWSRDPVTVTATASDIASGMAPVGSGPSPFTAIAVDGAPPVQADGDTAGFTLIGSGVHTVVYYARDAAGNTTEGGTTNGLPNRGPATAVVRIDREAPRIAFAGAQDPRNPERIEAQAADGLSGLDSARGSIGVRAAGSKTPFTKLPTETHAGALRADWDSGSWPPGEYEFRATAFDAAGNSATTDLRANGRPMRLPAPLKPAPRVLAQLGGAPTQSGRGYRLSGRLVAGRHAALAALPVRVLERFPAGAMPQQRVLGATTDAASRFEVRLEAGPSREVLVLSPATATLRAASSRPLRIAVPTRVGLRASSRRARIGGRPIVFSGRVGVTAARMPVDGKLVELEFRLAGLPWREFRTVRTNRTGRFRYAYRFADDDSRGVRFEFRAVAPAQAGWPYEPAGSRPVAVTGF